LALSISPSISSVLVGQATGVPAFSHAIPMSANSFDTELPSIRQVQSIIREKKTVEVKLMTGDILAGAVSWQDANAICVKDGSGQNTILMRGAIAYVKAEA